jgi:predicted nucleotidyltransferase
MEKQENLINKALDIIKVRKYFDKVRFIILYGSVAEGRAREDSDIDLAVYYQGSEEDASQFRLEVLSELLDDSYDVQIFNHLPLYIRKDVLKGEVLYYKDHEFLHEVAYQTLKEFEDFKKYYYDYIGEEMIS